VEHSRIQSYRDLRAWRKSVAVAVEIYRVTRKLPADERFGLIPQLRRAAVSISSNIGEGHGSSYRKTYLRHLSVARGSLMEVESVLHVTEHLEQLAPADLADSRRLLDETSRLITALKRSLSPRKTKPDSK